MIPIYNDHFSDLPNSDVTSFFNLATTVLLLAVVWVVLGPILTGEMVLVQARQSNTINSNARTDIWDYEQGTSLDTLSTSASNLYKWWTEQYFPENSHEIDSFQTKYDDIADDNRRIYETDNTAEYDIYSG